MSYRGSEQVPMARCHPNAERKHELELILSLPLAPLLQDLTFAAVLRSVLVLPRALLAASCFRPPLSRALPELVIPAPV